MLTDIHARDKRGGSLHFKKVKKPKDFARAMKKKRNKEDCEEKGSYLSNYSSVLLFSIMKKKRYSIKLIPNPIFTGSHKMDRPTMRLVFLLVSRK